MSEGAPNQLTVSRLADVLAEVSNLKHRLLMENPTGVVSERLTGIEARVTNLEGMVGKALAEIERLVEILEKEERSIGGCLAPDSIAPSRQ